MRSSHYRPDLVRYGTGFFAERQNHSAVIGEECFRGRKDVVAAGHEERANVLSSVRAMNEIEEWGPSDHCRLMIEVKDNARVAVPKKSRAPGLSSQPAECVSSRIAMPKVHEAIKLIEADDWRKVTTKGSHRQFKHPMKTGRVTITGRLSDDLG